MAGLWEGFQISCRHGSEIALGKRAVLIKTSVLFLLLSSLPTSGKTKAQGLRWGLSLSSPNAPSPYLAEPQPA